MKPLMSDTLLCFINKRAFTTGDPRRKAIIVDGLKAMLWINEQQRRLKLRGKHFDLYACIALALAVIFVIPIPLLMIPVLGAIWYYRDFLRVVVLYTDKFIKGHRIKFDDLRPLYLDKDQLFSYHGPRGEYDNFEKKFTTYGTGKKESEQDAATHGELPHNASGEEPSIIYMPSFSAPQPSSPNG